MKELIKPNKIEELYSELEALCEIYCRPGVPCNKDCDGQGTRNESPVDDMDILF